MVSQNAQAATEPQAWSPTFVDYLFLAFNTSTGLSPTDVPVLSRWAKLLMMLQSIIGRAARVQCLRRFGQRFGLLLVAASLFRLNHLFAVTDGKISMKLVFLGSIVLGFGILAAMSPDYVRAMKARTQLGDGRWQVVAAAIVLASLAFACWLWGFYYRAENAEGLRHLLGVR